MNAENEQAHRWRWDREKRAYVCDCGTTDRPARGQTLLDWLETELVKAPTAPLAQLA